MCTQPHLSSVLSMPGSHRNHLSIGSTDLSRSVASANICEPCTALDGYESSEPE
ncbi:hypothetical protein SARC_16532, partial [Sphaeroforma arctica JP610]